MISFDKTHSGIVAGRKVEENMSYRIIRIYANGYIDQKHDIAGHYIYFKKLFLPDELLEGVPTFGIKIDKTSNDLIIPKEGEFIEVPYGFERIFITIADQINEEYNHYVDLFIGSNIHYGEIEKVPELTESIKDFIISGVRTITAGVGGINIPLFLRFGDNHMKTIVIRNVGAQTVYLGCGNVGVPYDVTIVNGYPLEPDESISIDLHVRYYNQPPQLYGIVAAGTCDVRYLFGA